MTQNGVTNMPTGINREMTDLDVVEFYNDRGEGERLFDEINNDFLWKKMPFSFLNENTVFLIMMAICRNLYHFLTDFISKKLDFIKPTFRLKKFIFRFMVVPSKWITQGRQQMTNNMISFVEDHS